ncbi:MAG: ORC1-type DNA replication protein [Nanoarchaeota archaeon]|nr:ORC1-type DNA replication protein [Nanoarchaeota archaeon]MBU1004232.1 ORC1-type DNA replication protein [Nanoarchaeota archaeon]MBU1945869.1 ORC1-type DNA replication protein [Nanoarchaeota archaeon]
MGEKGLTSFFEDFLSKESLFSNKQALQSSFIPETISHRDSEIKQVANILAPTLKLEKPSNLFIYGKTGTGKTLTIKHITQNLSNLAKERNIPLKIIYLNCKLKKIADTEYRLIAQLVRELGSEIAATGLPTDEVYKSFFNILDSQKQHILLILDEIDQLVKKTGDEILYNLVRVNEDLKQSQITLVGISNDLIFVDTLDPRVRSSLSEEELVFPPYNAIQIQDILRQRSKEAFKEGSLGEGVIEKCAAYAAREHGDARRALELLRVAAEVAERNNLKTVNITHIDEAEDKIEKDRIIDTITHQPKQSQATLYSIISLFLKRKESIFTGDIYEVYKNISPQIGLRPLTQRRISDIVAELDMLGIINAKVISKGRHGRTREISVLVPPVILNKMKKVLEEGLALS